MRFASVIIIGLVCVLVVWHGPSLAYAQSDDLPPRPGVPDDINEPEPEPEPEPTPGPGPGLSYDDSHDSADKAPVVVVVLEAVPNIWVEADGTITYDVHVRNIGSADAPSVTIFLHGDPCVVTFLGVSDPSGASWFWSNESEDELLCGGGESADASLPSLACQNYALLVLDSLAVGEEHTVQVHAQVADGLVEGTVAEVWASFNEKGKAYPNDEVVLPLPAHVQQQNPSLYRQSNIVPVLVGSVQATSPLVWMGVTPMKAENGTVFAFFSDRFLPGEDVSTWINTPCGVVPLKQKVSVDDQGRVLFHYRSDVYCTGFYEMVAHGWLSDLTAAAVFEVEP